MLSTYLVVTIILWFLIFFCIIFTFGWLAYLYMRLARTRRLVQNKEAVFFEQGKSVVHDLHLNESQSKSIDLDAYQNQLDKSIKVFTSSLRYIPIVIPILIFAAIIIKDSTKNLGFHLGIGEIALLCIAASLIVFFFGSSSILKKELLLVLQARQQIDNINR